VIATGGLAGLIAAETPVIEQVDQRLMLEGLRLIYEMNASSPQPDSPAQAGRE
jgi:type III pantothenate kinase